jgi:hypothetical protein
MYIGEIKKTLEEMWVLDTNTNTKTKEIKYFGDKEEVILALYQAFRNLQGLAVSEIEKVEKQCSEKKAQPKKK